jgi:hypothetical protein
METWPFRWNPLSTRISNLYLFKEPFPLTSATLHNKKGRLRKKCITISQHKKLSGLRDKFYCRLLIGLWSREVDLIHFSVGRVVSVVLLFLCLNQIASDGNIPAAIKTRQHSRLSQSPAIVQWVALNISRVYDIPSSKWVCRRTRGEPGDFLWHWPDENMRICA